jgi:hypothetical protein
MSIVGIDATNAKAIAALAVILKQGVVEQLVLLILHVSHNIF